MICHKLTIFVTKSGHEMCSLFYEKRNEAVDVLNLIVAGERPGVARQLLHLPTDLYGTDLSLPYLPGNYACSILKVEKNILP